MMPVVLLVSSGISSGMKRTAEQSFNAGGSRYLPVHYRAETLPVPHCHGICPDRRSPVWTYFLSLMPVMQPVSSGTCAGENSTPEQSFNAGGSRYLPVHYRAETLPVPHCHGIRPDRMPCFSGMPAGAAVRHGKPYRPAERPAPGCP